MGGIYSVDPAISFYLSDGIGADETVAARAEGQLEIPGRLRGGH